LNDFKEELYPHVGGIAKGETKIKTENPHKKIRKNYLFP